MRESLRYDSILINPLDAFGEIGLEDEEMTDFKDAQPPNSSTLVLGKALRLCFEHAEPSMRAK